MLIISPPPKDIYEIKIGQKRKKLQQQQKEGEKRNREKEPIVFGKSGLLMFFPIRKCLGWLVDHVTTDAVSKNTAPIISTTLETNTCIYLIS